MRQNTLDHGWFQVAAPGKRAWVANDRQRRRGKFVALRVEREKAPERFAANLRQAPPHPPLIIIDCSMCSIYMQHAGTGVGIDCHKLLIS